MPIGGDYDGSVVGMLERLCSTAELEGLAIVDLTDPGDAPPIAYHVGVAGPDTVAQGRSLLTGRGRAPVAAVGTDKRPILVCPWALPPNRPGGLLLWRAPRGRRWAESDLPWAASVAMLLASVIGAGVGQVGIDRLTSVPNRRWFLDEADRHIDRLDLDGMTGTLLLIDVDDMRRVNLSLGRPLGDGVLVRVASQLRAMVRPTDLVARVGADEFAVWQDGMDQLTAAERADMLCTRRMFQDLPDGHGVTLSVGIATRAPGSGEDIRTLLRRAHMAAREVKGKGGGGWRVAQGAATSR